MYVHRQTTYVSMEYTFVEKRLYEELIISRERGKEYSGIEWNLERQSLLSNQGREYDELVFSVTMFADKDWEFLKSDWESHRGYRGDRLGLEEHERKRESLLLGMTETFFFDTVFVSTFLTDFFFADSSLADFFGADSVAFAFQPNLFNFPTTAFFDMPNFLPISDVDNPLPTNAFNFFSILLSQPVLIIKNPLFLYLI